MKKAHQGIRRDYRFKEMKVGETFFADDAKTNQVNAAAYAFKRKNPGIQFTCKQFPNGVSYTRTA